MNITIASTGNRSMLRGSVLATVALIGLAPAATFAAIKSVTIETTSWNPFAIVAKDRTPLFRGNNTIRVVGTDPGITMASAFELRRGTCPTTTAAGTLVASGVIRSREVKDYAGLSSLTITVSVRQARTLGTDYCGHIVYPMADRDTFTARLLSRGTVTGVTHNDANGQVAGGAPVTFTWTGVGMNPATINMNLTPLVPGLTGRTITGSPPSTTTTVARLTFAYCGVYRISPTLLFDPNAPTAFALDGKFRYQGTSFAQISVVGNCTYPPSAPPPSSLAIWCLDKPDTATDECAQYR